ncbi:MAG: TetR/AcrR family transcriptional regulator [Acutalibacteraceae bacterium]
MTQEERTRTSRALILDAAAKEFAIHGYKHASVNRICERGHISKGRMFHHFKDKDDIFVGVFELFYDSIGEHMQKFVYSEDDSLEDVLNNFFRHRQKYIFEHPYQAIFIRDNLMSVPEINRERCSAIRDSFWKKEDGLLRKILNDVYPGLEGDEKELAIKIFGIASSYVHFNVTANINFDPEKDMTELRDSNAYIFSRVIKIMLYGIYPRS